MTLLALVAVWSPAVARTDTASHILLPGLRWLVQISAAPAVSPLVADGYVYLSLKPGTVAAFRTKDGREAWRVPLAADHELASGSNLVFVPAAEAVHALDVATGRELWLAPTGTITAPLLVRTGWLIAISGEKLSAYRAADGSRVWTGDLGEIREQPTIDGDTLYVSTTDGRVLALDLASGQQRWEQRLGGAGRQPLVYGDRVYVGSNDRWFYALKTKDGERDWRWQIGAELLGRADADEQHVYVTAMDNLLRAFDRASGAQRWRQALPFRPVSGPVVIGEAVVVPGVSDNLLFFDGKAGRLVRQLKLDARLAVPPGFGIEPGDTMPSVAAITGGLADVWRLWLYGPLGPPPEAPPIEPLSVLPGLSARPGT